MSRTRLSSKGQIVIPKDVRDVVRWTPGAELDVAVDGNVVTIRQVERTLRLPTSEEVDRVAGVLKYNGPPKTLEDIDRELTESFRKDWSK